MGFLTKLLDSFRGRKYECQKCGNVFRGNKDDCPRCGHTVFKPVE